jgi:hypothetical protein
VPHTSTDPKLFCLTQRLSVLTVRSGVRPYLSGERFWDERNAGKLGREQPERVWRGVKRDVLVRRLQAGGTIRRWAFVCAGGFGKSANLERLERELNAARQTAFRFELDDRRLPATVNEFWETTLPERFRTATGQSGLPTADVHRALTRLQQTGRITLLLDSIDQATAAAKVLVPALLGTGDWAGCPIVVSARPHAVFDDWDGLIGRDEAAWRFVRVEPLAPKQRVLLLGPDLPNQQQTAVQDERRKEGARRYRLIPPGGRDLLGNPRHVEYVRKLADRPAPGERPEPTKLKDYHLRDLRTASHLYAGAADHAVRYGMTVPKARKLGRRKDRPAPEQATDRQIAFAVDLLGALAFAMYCQQAPGTKKKDGFRPNVSHVPADEMGDLLGEVLKRLKAAKVVDREYDAGDLDDDLDALAELNVGVNFDLLDTRPQRHGDFRWHDPTLQEFFAAWWLSRYATVTDLKRLRTWRYDDTRDRTAKSLFEPLWGFLVEMPRAVRKEKVWAGAVGVLFEHGVTRCCEMIHRAWPAVWRSRVGRGVIENWRAEFTAFLDRPDEKGDAAREVRDPARIRRCPMAPKDDGKPFRMGSSETEKDHRDGEHPHEVVVSPFTLHDFPVTNAQYELFDPIHERERWGYSDNWEPHPAGAEAGGHPAVNVTWFQAWCFARWVGGRLPTEAEWEYACRAGTTTAFWCGETLDETRANFNRSMAATTPRGRYPANPWGLYDLHGNVWEWCRDYYSNVYYQRGRATDPHGPKRGSYRVLRGGSWGNSAGGCRSACRGGGGPEFRIHGRGFRLAAVPSGRPVKYTDV